MRARIFGTGSTLCMENEIVLDYFNSLAIKDLVKKALEQDNKEKVHSCDRSHWEEFIRMFDMAYTVPGKMEEASLEHLYK